MTDCKDDASKVFIDWKKVFVSRQEFLKLVGVISGAIIGLVVALPGVAFMFSYFFKPQPNEWVSVGPIEKFKTGETVDVVFKDPAALPWDGETARRTAWLRRVSDETFFAFALNCTHLGCPVRWEAEAKLFMCPCHGGVYDNNGDVAAGPPPRPLMRYPVRIANGQVEIKSVPVLNKG